MSACSALMTVIPLWPSLSLPVSASGRVAPRVNELVTYEVPMMHGTSMPSNVFKVCAKVPGSKEDYAIFMDNLYTTERVLHLKVCGHEYHRRAPPSWGALNADPMCPLCHRMVRNSQGHSPSGKMTIETSPVKCSGFESCAS